MEPLDYILTINSGSSSLKVTLFTSDLKPVLDLHLKEKKWDEVASKLERFLDGKKFVIGHRFVHGGELYREATFVSNRVIVDLKTPIDLAPLHNRPCLEGILWAKSQYNAPQFVFFDTTFFKDLPEVAKRYAISSSLTAKEGLWRYGFHGISHHYLLQKYSELESGKKIITLHLGSGCSITATQNGKPIETSMGYSPLEGLIMGTRSGDIDPQIIETLNLNLDYSVPKIIHLLNFESGLLGISEKTQDMQELLKMDSDLRALLAIDMFCHRIVKYVGGYIALLGGIDALIFSAGIGENCPEIRSKILKALSYFGFEVDETLNALNGSFQKITKEGKTPRAFVIKTDENYAIAKELQKGDGLEPSQL